MGLANLDKLVFLNREGCLRCTRGKQVRAGHSATPFVQKSRLAFLTVGLGIISVLVNTDILRTGSASIVVGTVQTSGHERQTTVQNEELGRLV